MAELRLWPTLLRRRISPWQQQKWVPIQLGILISLGVKYSAMGTSNKSRWKLNKADWGLFKTLCEKNINILSLQEDISTLSINFTNQLWNNNP